MPRITYIAHNGAEHEVDAPIGDSVMMAALANNVPGIDADCGGACACGTCHVMVDPAWMARVGVPGAMEEGMLGFVPAREPNSRLSCQIMVTEQLDGLVLRLPAFQV